MAVRGRKKGTIKTGGRKPGSVNVATADIRALAQVHGPWVIAELVKLAKGAEHEATRLGAFRELLDRGYGKSTQLLAGHDGGRLVINIMKPE